METEPDFSGYATKAGLTCSDGRVIMKDAFAHQHEATVPLVWQHGHTDPKNVLGHAVLENRADGVYARAYFNSTPEGQHVKTLVQHGDVVSLSIWANQLKERSKGLPVGSAWTTDAEFDAITAYFQMPTADEGFNIIEHGRH